MQVLIFGCGDTGRRVARLYREQDNAVTGVVRHEASARALRELDIEVCLLDLDRPPAAVNLPSRAACVFYLAPPPAHGEGDSRLQNALALLERNGLPARILYISTTGVYGDCNGDWIDETAPLNPVAPRAQRRVAAESSLREWCGRHRVPWLILRVAAIYGPGRLPLERLRAGMPAVHPDASGYSNRIHVDDLARICVKAMDAAPANSIYNVSDGNPLRFTDYLLLLAELSGLPAPPMISMQAAESRIDPGLMSFLRESKRIRNDKLLRELDITLHYPDARQGIAASLSARRSQKETG